MAPNKAGVDNSTTIRAASKRKQRVQSSNRSTANPFGSWTGGDSLASSLESLFSPHPHGKDAALASLLASHSKPPVNLGQASSLAAFGSFSNTQPPSSSSKPAIPQSLRDNHKAKSKHAALQCGTIESAPNLVDARASSLTQVDKSIKEATKASGSKDQHKQPSVARADNKSVQSSSSSASPLRSVVPTLPPGRKPVFRPVLASSTAISWPEMPVAGAKTVLHTLLEILAQPAVHEAIQRDLGRTPRRDASKVKPTDQAVAMDMDADADPPPSTLPSPQLLAGINSITRAVEHDIARDLHKLHTSGLEVVEPSTKNKGKAKMVAASPSIKVVFVCRQDLPQPALIAHLPMLIAARNAVVQACASDPHTSDHGVLLFALPSGSEHLLAKALNLGRASMLALTTSFSPSHLALLLTAIQRETGTICHVHAEWIKTALLAAKQSTSHLPLALALIQQPTAIKLLRTSQPTHLNACKIANKSRRKLRSAQWKKRKMQTQQRIRDLRAQLKHASNKQRQTANKAAKSRINPSSHD